MIEGPHRPTLREFADLRTEPAYRRQDPADVLAQLLDLQRAIYRERRDLQFRLEIAEHRLSDVVAQINRLRGAA